MMKRTPALALLLLAAAPILAATPSSDDQDDRLKRFLDAAYGRRVAFSPERMTQLGMKQDYGRLDDHTPAASHRELSFLREQKAQLEREFDPAKLGPQARLSYRLFKGDVERFEETARWQGHRFTFSALDMPTSNIPLFLINYHRIESVIDAEAYIARLKEVDRVMTEISADLTTRAANGTLEPQLVFAPASAGARKVITGSPFTQGPDTPLWADFKAKLSKLDVDGTIRDGLLTEAEAALRGPFRRGYERMISTLEAVAKRATGNEGVWRLPHGAAYYASRVALSTTTALTPDEIHRIGLEEMARIQDEMRELMRKVGFQGSLQQFFAHINTAPEFHYPNDDEGREQYLTDARAVVAEAMSMAPAKFRRLPKAQLEVRAVEKWREATAPIAFYNMGAPDGSRPGVYYVNLADLSQTLKPQLASIACHEGAPGHHFQFSLASELENLPTFRRRGLYFAYAEGWGMYAETFCEELGIYKDPYAKLGQLSGDAWRAARLVVDTGLHAKRWTREQAETYLKQNTLLSDLDATREVDRYLTVPGQATSYKIGHLKILELRRKAEAALGAKFDIRDFHDVVLTNGAVPLDVLEQLVDAYIAQLNSN